MKESKKIELDLFGDMACFTRPEQKVERITYDVPTPSAIRGILESIYFKPSEFYYEINEIQVMNPIRKMTFTCNETKEKINVNAQNVLIVQRSDSSNHAKGLTQRKTEVLRDVYYRVKATIIKREDAPSHINIISLYAQFMRRLEHGKCFKQPYFGLKEFVCYFSPIDEELKPIQESKNYGLMLYDVFDIKSNVPLNTDKKKNNTKDVIRRTIYNCEMHNGVIRVPDYDSEEVLYVIPGGKK